MISDEMRELLSAYVDGELRDADVARVEELTKRDTELRREVARFKKLRHRLREWDAAEQGGAPSTRMGERALTRARAWLSAHGVSSRLAIVHRALTQPIAIAAALLVTVLAGVWAASDNTPAPAPPRRVIVAQLDAQPPPALNGPATLSAVEVLQYPVRDRVFGDVWNQRVDGYFPRSERLSLKALVLKEKDDAMVRGWERVAARRAIGNRTYAPRNGALLSIVGPYQAEDAPYPALAMIHHAVDFSTAPILRALPLDRGVAQDSSVDPDLVHWDLSSADSRLRRLAPLGEVLAGLRDKSGRIRVVSRSTVVAGDRAMNGPMVWGDATELPNSSKHLVPLGLILGPKTRQLVLSAKARDQALYAAVQELARGKSGSNVLKSLRKAMKKDERTVRRLMDALESSTRVTGFAVLSHGKILGVELFATHDLMLQLAPRLLHGYLLEAPGAIEARAPSKSKVAEVMKTATRLLDTLPEQTIDFSAKKHTDGDVSELSLRSPGGGYVGHGLAKGKQPIHLTLFGE